MSNAERAKIFCRMSFVAPSNFPCVETHSASKIFNHLAYSDFTQEDFHDFLVEIFGADVDAGNSIFRLARTNFYKTAYKAFYDKDGAAFSKVDREFENTCKACKIFEGGDDVAIHSG